MSFGRTFKEALQKALRSLETGRHGLGADGKDVVDILSLTAREKDLFLNELKEKLSVPNPQRLFYVRYALLLDFSIADIHRITGIDPWFLHQMSEIVEVEKALLSLSTGNPAR